DRAELPHFFEAHVELMQRRLPRAVRLAVRRDVHAGARVVDGARYRRLWIAGDEAKAEPCVPAAPEVLARGEREDVRLVELERAISALHVVSFAARERVGELGEARLRPASAPGELRAVRTPRAVVREHGLWGSGRDDQPFQVFVESLEAHFDGVAEALLDPGAPLNRPE